jgi:hypothetical protein
VLLFADATGAGQRGASLWPDLVCESRVVAAGEDDDVVRVWSL